MHLPTLCFERANGKDQNRYRQNHRGDRPENLWSVHGDFSGKAGATVITSDAPEDPFTHDRKETMYPRARSV